MSLRKLEFQKSTKTYWKIREDIGFPCSRTPASVIPDELVRVLNKSPRLSVVGIDPGKNFGLSCVYPSLSGWEIVVMNGKLDDTKYPLRDVAFWFAQKFIHDCQILSNPKYSSVVIEGASYGDRYGQVKLAEVRCGFSLGFEESGIPVQIIAPKTPRKAVFGSGNTGAWEIWPTLNHNGADSLCLALYPYYQGG